MQYGIVWCPYSCMWSKIGILIFLFITNVVGNILIWRYKHTLFREQFSDLWHLKENGNTLHGHEINLVIERMNYSYFYLLNILNPCNWILSIGFIDLGIITLNQWYILLTILVFRVRAYSDWAMTFSSGSARAHLRQVMFVFFFLKVLADFYVSLLYLEKISIGLKYIIWPHCVYVYIMICIFIKKKILLPWM